MRTEGVRHPMDQACFEKSSKDLNFLKSERGIPATHKRTDLMNTD